MGECDDVMADVSLDLPFNTWDWFASDGDSFHLDTRTLLDGELSGDVGDVGGEQSRLRTYDVTTNNMDVQDALDGSTHQHLDEIMDERHARRKRVDNETEEAQVIKVDPWSLKYSNIFLFVCNFLMLFVYYNSSFLAGVPWAVWLIVMGVHLSAIALFVLDSVTHTLQEKGICIPKQEEYIV